MLALSWFRQISLLFISKFQALDAISIRNVDGLRAWIKKSGLEFFVHEKPDVICLQEIKCSKEKLPKEITVRKFFFVGPACNSPVLHGFD